MALFNTMGSGSSPLFITGSSVPGLDPSALQYYAEKKDKADEKLALRLASEKPSIEEFDKKMKGLAGDKNYLYQNYLQSVNKVTQGVNKYGGLWAAYANSPEGKQDIAQVGSSVYDAQVANENFNTWYQASEKVSKQNLGAQRWLDNQTFTPTGTKGKVFNNQDYLNFEAQNPTLDDQGHLKQKDLQVLETGSQLLNKELQDIYTTVGTTEWSQLSEGDQKLQNVGAYAYNTLTRTKNAGKSNQAQLDAAGKMLYENLSDSSKGTLWNEIYDMTEGKRANVLDNLLGEKVNTKKLYSDAPEDQDYRTAVMQRYMAYRVQQGEDPYLKKGSETEHTISNFGRAEGFGLGDKVEVPVGWIGQVQSGNLIPKTNTGNQFYLDAKTGKYVAMTNSTQEFGGVAAVQGFQQINKDIKDSPQTLGSLGVKGFVYGDNAQTVDNPNSGLGNAQVVSFNKVVTGDSLIFDPGTKTYRKPTVQEKEYQAQVIKKAGDNPQANLTPDELKIYNDAGHYYYDVTVNLGKNGENGGSQLTAKKNVDGEAKDVTAVSDVLWMGEDIDNDNVTDTDNGYQTHVLVPAEDIDVGTGNNDKEIQAGYQFMRDVKDHQNQQSNVESQYKTQIYNQMQITPSAAAVNAQY